MCMYVAKSPCTTEFPLGFKGRSSHRELKECRPLDKAILYEKRHFSLTESVGIEKDLEILHFAPRWCHNNTAVYSTETGDLLTSFTTMRDPLKALTVLLAVLVGVVATRGSDEKSFLVSDCEVVAVSEGTPVGSEMYVFHLPSYVSNVTVVSPQEGVLEDWGVRVDSDSGQVIAIGRLDREQRDWVQIDAFITDYSTSDAAAEPQFVSVCLNITDENDCAPEWTMQPYPYLAAVPPDAPPGTPVYQLTAHDADLYPNNVFSFYQIAGRSQHFQLDATNGTITTRGRPLVADQEYGITVMAQDTAGNQSPRVTVSILAGRRPPQFYQQQYTVDVYENQPVGTTVLTIQAKSFADLPISYSFVGVASSPFTLNDSTGAMTVVRPLSYDTMPHTFYFNVIATEVGFDGMASIERSQNPAKHTSPGLQLRPTTLNKPVREAEPVKSCQPIREIPHGSHQLVT